MSKKIIHVDMDCFYAQVEMRDRPELKNVPLAIGGLPGTRSVLCTSNYLARTFGVTSAMPSDYAIRLCPRLIILPPNFRKYQEASEIIQRIFLKYSSVVETVSLDEAYLDVSSSINATAIGKMIKDDIFKSTGLVASVGIAPNKFLAKVASDWKKPNGFFVIRPSDIESFVDNLSVKHIPGVGKKGRERLENLGVKTCRDLRELPFEIIAANFGKFGLDLFLFAHGKDEREIQSEWERKSLSVENTFLKDINTPEELKAYLEELVMEMKERIEYHLSEDERSSKKIKKLFIKIKYSDFKQSSTEESIVPFDIHEPLFHEMLSVERYFQLLKLGLAKKTSPVRLLGVGVRFQTSEDINSYQLSFFPLCA